MNSLSNQSGAGIFSTAQPNYNQTMQRQITNNGNYYTLTLTPDNNIIIVRTNKPGFLKSLIEFFTHRLFEGTLKSRSARLQETYAKQFVAQQKMPPPTKVHEQEEKGFNTTNHLNFDSWNHEDLDYDGRNRETPQYDIYANAEFKSSFD